MAVTSGDLPSTKSLVVTSLVLGMVFPGLGLIIVPAVIIERGQWGGLGWVAFWAAQPLIPYLTMRVHEVDGTTMVTRWYRRTHVRSLTDVTSVGPARWFYPGARATFADGSTALLTTPNGFLDAVVAAVPPQLVSLPPGNWLRRRRLAWWAVAILGVVGN